MWPEELHEGSTQIVLSQSSGIPTSALETIDKEEHKMNVGSDSQLPSNYYSKAAVATIQYLVIISVRMEMTDFILKPL